MTTPVDVIVLGTGSAAQSVAYPCREGGLRVAVVDYHPFGGTCQLRGCDPKKVLVSVVDLVDWSRRMLPISCDDSSPGWSAIKTVSAFARPSMMVSKPSSTAPTSHTTRS